MTRALWRLVAVVTLAACGGSPAEPDAGPDPDAPIAIPALGTAATLDVATWNIQSFGSPTNGPSDEGRQRARARDVILGTDADLWGVQEISDAGAFRALVSELPGYEGVLATDAAVQGGAASYSDFGDTELKVGLVFKAAVVEIMSARVILTELDHEFAGRPPVEASVRLSVGGVTKDAVVVVLHAKADTQLGSWERRRAAGEGLHAYLDQTWPDRPVFVVGDWNDDIDTSITSGRDTPYRSFVDAAPLWVFATAPLTEAGLTSILGFDDVIDHILVSDESMAWYETDSTVAYRVDDIIPGYRESTSDHLPVLARFRLAG